MTMMSAVLVEEPTSSDELEDDEPSGEEEKEQKEGEEAGDGGEKGEGEGEGEGQIKKSPTISRKGTKKLLRVNTKASLGAGINMMNPMSALMPGSPMLTQQNDEMKEEIAKLKEELHKKNQKLLGEIAKIKVMLADFGIEASEAVSEGGEYS